MFMGSTIQKILDTTKIVADYLQIEAIHRDPCISEMGCDPLGDGMQPHFRVSIGEIHWEGSYVLLFNRTGMILSIVRETYALGGGYMYYINRHPVDVPPLPSNKIA